MATKVSLALHMVMLFDYSNFIRVTNLPRRCDCRSLDAHPTLMVLVGGPLPIILIISVRVVLLVPKSEHAVHGDRFTSQTRHRVLD
jgi:hypothetical protein